MRRRVERVPPGRYPRGPGPGPESGETGTSAPDVEETGNPRDGELMGYAVLSNRNTRVGVQRKNTVKAELANLMARNDLAEASAEITFIPPGKLRCVITDRLRNDTPEENVRQRVARSLIDEYGYGREDIAVEFTVNLGSSKKRVDLAIFPPEPNTNSRMLT